MTDAVLIPVYDEAAYIGDVLEEVRRRFAGTIIVVDDGSNDGTADVLAACSDIVVVTHAENLGYGAALSDGFEWAMNEGIERLVTMDADLQHEPRHIAEFLNALEGGWDVVSGSRYHPASGTLGAVPEDRVRINRLVTAEVARLTGWPLTDAFCGFKAYRVEALRRVLLHEPGYGVCMEFWARAFRADLTVTEIPIERIYIDHGRSFGIELDDAEARLAYYMSVWRSALERVVA